ncbi:MAG: hypothetical protein AAF171_05350 [Cyanobacteria bacterium P01_A01_bin.116]
MKAIQEKTKKELTTTAVKKRYQALYTEFQGARRTDLTESLRGHYGWGTSRSNEAITQYLMFLSLAAHYTGPKTPLGLVPTADVDRVWEMDILNNTARYMQLCQQLCGRVIHHVGATEFNRSSNTKSVEVSFAWTSDLFSQYFGDRALGKAPRAAACGVLIEKTSPVR